MSKAAVGLLILAALAGPAIALCVGLAAAVYDWITGNTEED